MGEVFLKEAGVTIRKSTRAKHLQIRICPRRGAELVIPKGVTLKTARGFLKKHEAWIRSKMPDMLEPTPFSEGKDIPILGALRRIVLTSEPENSLTKTQLRVNGASQSVDGEVRAFLHQLAYETVSSYVQEYASRLGVSYGKISIRDTHAQWGSCSPKGNLSFCWRIILSPEAVVRYLAAHEVSHLIERNHSDQFWKIVRSLCPGYENHRQWLKENSRQLHSYGS